MGNSPIRLNQERQKREKKPWERLPGERAYYFQLFQRYCAMGRGRSLQAIWEQEHPVPDGTPDAESENGADASSSLSSQTLRLVSKVSGTWRKQAAAWKWHERAEAWDAWQREEKHRILLDVLTHEGQYITQAQRIDALDALMCGLMSCMDRESRTFILASVKDPVQQFKLVLAYTRQMVTVLARIRLEVKDFEELDRK